MANVTAENRKRVEGMLEQGMPAEQVAKKLRSQGVKLQFVLDTERELKMNAPKAVPAKALWNGSALNPTLMTSLATLVGRYGAGVVEATFEHLMEVQALMSKPTPLDRPELVDDESDLSAQLAAGNVSDMEIAQANA